MRVMLDPNGLGGVHIAFQPDEAELSLATLEFLIQYGEDKGWDASAIRAIAECLKNPVRVH